MERTVVSQTLSTTLVHVSKLGTSYCRADLVFGRLAGHGKLENLESLSTFCFCSLKGKTSRKSLETQSFQQTILKGLMFKLLLYASTDPTSVLAISTCENKKKAILYTSVMKSLRKEKISVQKHLPYM